MNLRTVIFFCGLIHLVFSTHSFAQVDEDCQRMYEHADSSFHQGNYELALNKLEAAKLCADDSKYGEKVTELQIAIFNKIISERDEAIRLRKEQEELREDLQLEFNKSQEFLRVKYLIDAQEAIGRGEFGAAVSNIDKSLEIGESNQTGLVIAKLFEKRPPELLDQLASISMFDLNPENPNLIAYVGARKAHHGNDVLRLLDKSTKAKRTVGGKFTAIGFERDGDYLYGVKELESGLIGGKRRTDKYNPTVGIVKYGMDLKPIDTIEVSQVAVTNRTDEVWLESLVTSSDLIYVGEYKLIDFTPNNAFMVLTGTAVIGERKFELRTWINLRDGSVKHHLGRMDRSPKVPFRHSSLILNDSIMLANMNNIVLAINLETGKEEEILKNEGYIASVSMSPDKKRLIILDMSFVINIWDKIDNDWFQVDYGLQNTQTYIEVAMIRNNQLAIEKRDHRILLVTLNEDLTVDTVNLDGHTDMINSMTFNEEGAAFVSSGEDAQSIIWSFADGSRINLSGSGEGVIDARLINNGNEQISISRDGFLMSHLVTKTAKMSISANPFLPIPEKRMSDESYDKGGYLKQKVRRSMSFSSSLTWDDVDQVYYVEHFNDSISMWNWSGKMRHIKNLGKSHLDSTIHLYYVDRVRNRIAHMDTNNNFSFRSFEGDAEANDIIKGKFSPSGKIFAFYNENKEEFQIWTTEKSPILLKSFKFLNTSAPDLSKLLFSDDEHLLAFPCKNPDNAIGIIDLGRTSGFLFTDDNIGKSFDLSPKGDAVVVAGNNGEVIFYSIEMNKKAILGRHSRYVSSVAFSSNGKLIASGSRDRTVRLWSLESNTFKPEYSSYTYLNPVENVSFSPDDSLLICLTGSSLNFIPTTRSNLVHDYQNATYLDSWGELYANSISSPDSILAIVPVGNGYKDRSAYASNILARKIVMSEKNQNDIVATIVNPDKTTNEKTEAIIELSIYKDQALNSLPAMVSIFSTSEFKLNPIQQVLLSELLTYTGTETENALVTLSKSGVDANIQLGILQFLVKLFPKSSTTNQLLESNFTADSKQIRLFSAIHCESLGDNNEGVEILVNGLGSGIEMGDLAIERIRNAEEAALPSLIHFLRFISASQEEYLTMPKTYNELRKLEALVKGLIFEHKTSAKSYLRDSINAEKIDLNYKSKLISIYAEIGGNETTDLDFYIKQINEHISDTLNIRLFESCVEAIGQLSIDITKAAPALIEVLKIQCASNSNLVTQMSLSSIGPAIVPLLIDALPNTNQKQRNALYYCLKPYGEKSAEVLPYLLKDVKTCPNEDSREILALLGALGPLSSDALPNLYDRLLAIDVTQPYFTIWWQIRNLIDAMVEIKSNPRKSTNILLDKMEQIVSSDDLLEYKVTDATIKSLRNEDVPDTVIRILSPMVSRVFSRYNYESHLVDILGDEDFESYQELIFKYSLIEEPHSCQNATVFSEGCEAIAELGYNSARTRRRLRRLQKRTASCSNVQADIEKLLVILEKDD